MCYEGLTTHKQEGRMYLRDELDDRITREYAWFDAGFFAGLLVGGLGAWVGYEGCTWGSRRDHSKGECRCRWMASCT